MKRITSFLAGVCSTVVVASITIGALALSGNISFNKVNVALNGTKIGSEGETYTTSSGTKVPYSIVYKDENGGGTTYLPVRKVSELLNIDISWNQNKNMVMVGKTPSDPDIIISDPNIEQNKEEEIKKKMEGKIGSTLQAFDGMFTILTTDGYSTYYCSYNGDLSLDEVSKYWNSLSDEYIKEQTKKFVDEIYNSYLFKDDIVVSCIYYKDKTLLGEFCAFFIGKNSGDKCHIHRPMIIM